MPLEDWFLVRNDTNINESAHTLTNAYTGIRHSLFDAISTACEADKIMAARICEAEDHGILPNHRNTDSHRMKANQQRKEGQQRKAAEHRKAVDKLNKIDEKIQELRAEKKGLQESHRVQQSCKRSSGSKTTMDAANLDIANNEFACANAMSATNITESDSDLYEDEHLSALPVPAGLELGLPYDDGASTDFASGLPCDDLADQAVGMQLSSSERLELDQDLVSTPKSPFRPRQWTMAQLLQMSPGSVKARFPIPSSSISATTRAAHTMPMSTSNTSTAVHL
ncbi:hypothetical protein EWM64_g4285 [Hericium alpestre]|uniref:Uncharacterized protein n=1 Tax=Hericium alpestre TaxID=135208 RepID=A0A4Y9ZYZ3_9AGAM|nr:hypothetical protein EWM64_g4285 [Hericium alpestre]